MSSINKVASPGGETENYWKALRYIRFNQLKKDSKERLCNGFIPSFGGHSEIEFFIQYEDTESISHNEDLKASYNMRTGLINHNEDFRVYIGWPQKNAPNFGS